VAEKYLRWLSEINKRRRTVLIWDVFAAHRDQAVKDLAEELNIQLIFIPAGQTDEYQPLDRRIFGPMKQMARARWASLFIRNFDADPGMKEALKIMIGVWHGLTQDNILCAWDHLTQW
jgi:hypothetical protein